MRTHDATLEDEVGDWFEDEHPGKERRLPAPLSVAELLKVEEPDEEWLAEGAVPAGGNFLVAGHPKTHKTMFLLELGVALATATPLLGRFPVPERRRFGAVVMEDAAHRVRRRLHRLCLGRGLDLASLDGWLYLWSRPPLRLNDQTAAELGDYAAELELDYLHVDSWAYVASGNSDSADEVTPQLMALSSARLKRPGLTVGLTHHARKAGGESDDGSRLVDTIRNSGAFAAWYDGALVLTRRDETSPITVRAELRDHAPPEPFSFQVGDEYPADATRGGMSSGWLRLTASDQRPEVADAEHRWRKLLPAVRDYIAAHPGCTGRDLEGLTGRRQDIVAAARWLEATEEARYEPPARKGLAGRWHPVEEGASGCVPGASGTQVPGGASDRVPDAYVVGGDRTHPGSHNGAGESESDAGRTSDGYNGPRCTAGCGAPVGRPGLVCGVCAAQVTA